MSHQGIAGYQAVTFGCRFSTIENRTINGKRLITDYGNPIFEVELDSPALTRQQFESDNRWLNANYALSSPYSHTNVTYLDNEQFLTDIGSVNVNIPRPDDSTIFLGVTRGTFTTDANFPNNYVEGTKGNNYITLHNAGFYTGTTFKRGQLFQIVLLSTTEASISTFGVAGAAVELNVYDKVYMFAEDYTVDASNDHTIKIFPKLLTSFTFDSSSPYAIVPLQFFKCVPIEKSFEYDSDINGYFQYTAKFEEIA